MTSEELISFSKQTKFSDNFLREITPEEATKLLGFTNLLSKWTDKMSLVSSSDTDRIVHEHILDCWAAFQFVPRETTYLDIGSGAGLPGVVFAILAPSSKVLLLEPRAKRIEFLKESRRVLGLENIETIESRLEDWSGLKTGVSAVERAVGMEGEIYGLLQDRVEDFTFSAMVSMEWLNPLRDVENHSASYALPNGTIHQVVCFT
jgi:16S rRNA (guanine(527)-N(7))-methyltransferase RsmG